MKYKLSVDAENDLDEIWDYSFKNWGKKQANNYINELIDCFEKISKGNILYKNIVFNDKVIKSVHCRCHYIFFSSGDRPVVIRILHEKMDMISILQNRLAN